MLECSDVLNKLDIAGKKGTCALNAHDTFWDLVYIMHIAIQAHI